MDKFPRKRSAFKVWIEGRNKELQTFIANRNADIKRKYKSPKWDVEEFKHYDFSREQFDEDLD